MTEVGYSVNKGYVIMLDILGFREHVTNEIGYSFLDTWKEIITPIIDKAHLMKTEPKYITKIDALFLSDTMFIGCGLKNPNERFDIALSLMGIPWIIDDFFTQCMFKHKIFLRGAISFGEYAISDTRNIVMGAAVNECSEWYEKTNWMGIILTPSAQYAIDAIVEHPKTKIYNDLGRLFKRFRPYDKIPFKDGVDHVCKYAFYWFKTTTNVDELKQHLSDVLKLYSSLIHIPAYASKYSNSLEFIRWCIDNDIREITKQEGLDSSG